MEGGGFYTARINLVAVREAKPAKIYYGANTCWWTHDPEHVRQTRAAFAVLHPDVPAANHLPCDPRGGVLFETDDVEGFLAAAEEKPEHYGHHGLAAFMAAHHLNCVRSRSDPRSWCFREWDDYSRLLDEALVS
jgi:hypothetical protein